MGVYIQDPRQLQPPTAVFVVYMLYVYVELVSAVSSRVFTLATPLTLYSGGGTPVVTRG